MKVSTNQTISILLPFYSFYLLPNLLLDAVFNDDCPSKIEPQKKYNMIKVIDNKNDNSDF